jgi:predicted short-subunit dehydrogenase-like oxidoreductase (DUF2520 family)
LKTLNIVIIGTGNVAHHLADSFSKVKNAKLLQVFNHRLSKESKALAKQYNSELVTDYRNINREADIYIIAVKDDAIKEVAKNLKALKLKGLVVHTSGSVDVTVLKNVSTQIGVYYPLQTFYPKAKIDWKTTPLLIEANTKTAMQTLKKLADSVSKNVKVLSSEERLGLHLAAVFACNFTNALYVSAYELIEKQLSKKDTTLLMPIMEHSFNKLKQVHPILAQTGPAKRKDKTVIAKHLTLLKNNKELTTVYKLLSQVIATQQDKTHGKL